MWIIALLTGISVAQATPPKPFQCSGHHRSHVCTVDLHLNNCKNSIRLHWTPLQLPGNTEWEKSHRNWCTLTFDGIEAKEVAKLPPEKCEKVVEYFAAGFQGFPELPWQDAQCTHMSGKDGILYLSQKATVPKVKDPEPLAARIEEARACELHVVPVKKGSRKTKRYIHCPVLEQRVFSWLKKVGAEMNLGVVLQNPLK